MKRIFSSLILLAVVPGALAFVDTKNAGYTKTYRDAFLSSSNLPLSIQRTYNSRSLYKGMFGYGWCSNLETRVEVRPDGSLLAVECGGGKEVLYISSSSQSNSSVIVEKIMAEVKKNKSLSQADIQDVENNVKKSSLLRSEMIRAFNLQGRAKAGQVYQAVGQLGESVQFHGNRYVRKQGSGEVEIFNRQGLLVQKMDSSGNWIKITRSPKGQITRVMDNKGRALRFQYVSNTRIRVQGPGGLSVQYTLDKKDNLVHVKNSKGDSYTHRYDSYHNLISTKYPDGTEEKLTYNTSKDWVVGFVDRKGCVESYSYNENKKNRDHYWTDVKKMCGKKVTNFSRYEFWNKSHPAGGKYLYRARQKINTTGRQATSTDMIFDYRTGFPLSTTRNGVRTRFAYNADNTLKHRIEPFRKIFYLQYHNKCKKPQQVRIHYLHRTKPKKVIRKISTALHYDPGKCHLLRASQKPSGRWVSVKRDFQGRIVDMWDQSKKRILVSYDERVGKPQRISRPGIGSVKLVYDKEGNADTSKTTADPAVAVQITAVFNGFLEIISPIAPDITI